MIRFSVLRGAALALAAMLAAPAAAAQDTARPVPPAPPPIFPGSAEKIANPQPDNPAYGDLLDAIESTVDKTLMIDNGLAAIKRQMEANDALAGAEAASRGILDEIITNMRPVLERQNLRVTAQYRPLMAAAMADYLTPNEAGSVAAFYRSDIGRKLMGSVVKNFNMDQTMAKAMTDTPVSESDVNADIVSAVTKGMETMDAQDLAEMGRQAFSNPALLKLQRVNPQIQRLRAQMENEPMTPEEDAAIGAMIEGIFARRFPQ
ncbi:MAG: DUF2059 domain-containing protein [Porphyrobacter sp. IPPAS B-1204]|nr:MAG: DUF2059 domain-containing protein [Porphyrobacter sp. IPPAS B-1204]